MRSSGPLLAGVVVAAVVTIAAIRGFRPAEIESPIQADPDPDRFETPRADDSGVTEQLARIEATLGELAAAIETLRRTVDSLSMSSGARTPIVAPGPAPAAIDEESIVRALERVEEKKLEEMSVEQLLMQSNRLLKENDPAAARRAVEAVLARGSDPDERARALTQLGVVHRSSGDWEASARVLEGAIAEYGIDSPRGAPAAYQLVWTRCKAGDNDRALQLADTLARSARAGERMQFQARWAAAVVAEAAGDAARARTDYEALLRDYADRPEFVKTIQDVRRRLGRTR